MVYSYSYGLVVLTLGLQVMVSLRVNFTTIAPAHGEAKSFRLQTGKPHPEFVDAGRHEPLIKFL